MWDPVGPTKDGPRSGQLTTQSVVKAGLSRAPALLGWIVHVIDRVVHDLHSSEDRDRGD